MERLTLIHVKSCLPHYITNPFKYNTDYYQKTILYISMYNAYIENIFFHILPYQLVLFYQEKFIKSNLVRNNVEETLNALLDKEADELVNAEKYERSSDRQGYRSGHYKRNLHTTAGKVELKVPKLKGIPFESAIIERYRRRTPLWKRL